MEFSGGRGVKGGGPEGLGAYVQGYLEAIVA